MPCCTSFSDYKTYLINTPKELEELVLLCMSEEKIKELYERKSGKRMIEKTEYLAPSDFPVDPDYCIMSTKVLAEELIELSPSTNKLYEEFEKIAKVIAKTLAADDFSVYIPIQNESELSIYQDGKLSVCGSVGKGKTVAAHVVAEKCTAVVDNLKMDPRFPRGVHPKEISDCSVLCIPIILPSEDIVTVIEFLRRRSLTKPPLSNVELQLANAVLGWMTACIYENSIKRVLNTQHELNDFLLDTTRAIFDDMSSIDSVVQKIMMFTKDLVKADRCSLFLVDEEKQELYADYFDVGAKSADGEPLFEKKSQIRFQIHRGIAGHVAKSKQVVNIYNAYADPRFNADIDKATGYHTRNILCMPILSRDKVIGVVQLINSLEGDHFTHSDENAFKSFALYCALAIRYSIVFKMLRNQQNQNKVALEMLQYHANCSEEDVEALLKAPSLKKDQIPENFSSFDFCCYDYDAMLPQLTVHMVEVLFGEESFDLRMLYRFILTIKKNYRPIAYHNWEHGFHVAHSLYCKILKSPGIFTLIEKMSLIIGGLAHDIDHRGYNNAYFTKLNLPLANLYSTSVMEQHHCRQTVAILQQEQTNIFAFLQPYDYKKVLELIKHNIIATDLALYFGNQKTLASKVENDELDINDDETRLQVMGLMMTGADLCAICKPWSTQQTTAKKIYEEFYIQGDEEKRRGLKPLPMMDRSQENEIPKQQVGFISFICIPLYTTLENILPGTKSLLIGALNNKDHWANLAKRQEQQENKQP